MKKIKFDDSRARTYRKHAEVLAFRSEAPVKFEKTWGEQSVRKGGWIIVPLDDAQEPSDDVYGCDGDEFEATYEASPSQRANRYRKKETIRAYQPGHPFKSDTVLKDGHVEVEGASSESIDAWIARAPGGEVYPIEDETFSSIYVEVLVRTGKFRAKSRDEHWEAAGTPKRILALDGGGVRGVLTLGYLERIEEVLGQRHGDPKGFRLCHYFDLIAGTSTGAVIAACLAKGMRVGEVRERYENLASSVFRGSFFRRGVLRAKFSAKQLKKHLEDVFRNNTMGSAALQTGLLVVAKRLDTGSTWAMSNNPGNRFFTAGPNDTFFSNEDYPVKSVVRASTAAPSYFRPEYIQIATDAENPHGEFVDGGASPHNNPALLALQLVSVSGFGAGWSLDPDKLLLTSVGTGAARPGVSRSWFAGTHALKALLSLMNDSAESVETILQWLSASPTARVLDVALGDLSDDLLPGRPLFHYLRYNVQLNSDWIRENLDEELSEKVLKRLQKMDQPRNMPELSRLGTAAARLQIDETHFPDCFDLA